MPLGKKTIIMPNVSNTTVSRKLKVKKKKKKKKKRRAIEMVMRCWDLFISQETKKKKRSLDHLHSSFFHFLFRIFSSSSYIFFSNSYEFRYLGVSVNNFGLRMKRFIHRLCNLLLQSFCFSLILVLL